MRHLLPIAVLGLMLSTAATAAEPVRGSQPSGKVNMQDMHFSSRAAADAKCPGAAVASADGSFACSSSSLPAEPAGMAINEKGTSGTKPKPSTPK